ncbi:MAG: hypothetical protein NVSMB1_01490 [Polyangiales bacterium]
MPTLSPLTEGSDVVEAVKGDVAARPCLTRGPGACAQMTVRGRLDGQLTASAAQNRAGKDKSA